MGQKGLVSTRYCSRAALTSEDNILLRSILSTRYIIHLRWLFNIYIYQYTDFGKGPHMSQLKRYPGHLYGLPSRFLKGWHFAPPVLHASQSAWSYMGWSTYAGHLMDRCFNLHRQGLLQCPNRACIVIKSIAVVRHFSPHGLLVVIVYGGKETMVTYTVNCSTRIYYPGLGLTFLALSVHGVSIAATKTSFKSIQLQSEQHSDQTASNTTEERLHSSGITLIR